MIASMKTLEDAMLASRSCLDARVRTLLSKAAYDVHEAIEVFEKDRSADNLKRVNGFWARTASLYNLAVAQPQPDPPKGAFKEGALLQKAA